VAWWSCPRAATQSRWTWGQSYLSSINEITDEVITRVDVLRSWRSGFFVKSSRWWWACFPPPASVQRALALWAHEEADSGRLPSRLSPSRQYTLLHKWRVRPLSASIMTVRRWGLDPSMKNIPKVLHLALTSHAMLVNPISFNGL
jgi:hypothetical protein